MFCNKVLIPSVPPTYPCIFNSCSSSGRSRLRLSKLSKRNMFSKRNKLSNMHNSNTKFSNIKR